MTREYLTTPIQRLPEDQRTALGIFQSDIVVRTAIVAGLADLRENPKLLDFVFASLPKDDLTYRVYGEKQVELAKEWFLATDIPVFMNTRLDENKVPCITIGVGGSSETENTLADVHYQTAELDLDEAPITYGGPYTPLSYDSTTGVLHMNSTFSLDVFPGQLIRDRSGKTHEILEVLDNTTIVIEQNANANFSGMYVVSAPSKKTVTVESAGFRESFEIGCHAVGEPAYLTYLYSVALFILLRYREELLEARGLMRTTLSAGPVTLNQSFNVAQPVFTRVINLSGFVHQFWPKFFTQPYVGVDTQVTTPEDYNSEDQVLLVTYEGALGADET